jgi:hypothetical protein
MARITKSNLAKKTTLPDLPDSNSLSRRRARRPRVVATAPLPRPPPPSSYRSQSTQTDEPALNNNQGPRVFHSERERVDSILAPCSLLVNAESVGGSQVNVWVVQAAEEQ